MRTIVTLAAAGAIGLAGLAATPRQADAAWWIAPAIIAGVVGGAAIGASAANASAYNNGYAYEPAPAGSVYVRPTYGAPECRIMRERLPSGRTRRVQVCD